MAKEMEFIDLTLALLKYIKHYPYNFTKLGVFLGGLATFLRMFFIAFTITMLVVDVNLNTFINAMETLSTDVQGLFKLYVFYINRHKLIYLLTNLSNFLPTDYTYQNWYKPLVIYKYIIYLTWFVCIVRAFLTKELLFICWIPEFKYAFEILQATQIFVWTIDVFYVLCADAFFVTLSIIICHQFELFSEKLRIIDNESDPQIALHLIKEFVRQHNFMLNYIRRFNEAYNPVLVMQYVFNMYTICIELYILTERGGLGEQIFSLFYMTAILTQLSLYCFPSTEISSAAASLPYQIYSSRWYDKPNPIQKQYAFIIQHSLRAVEMRGANMVTMDRRAYVTVFKGALSVYTLIKKVNNK